MRPTRLSFPVLTTLILCAASASAQLQGTEQRSCLDAMNVALSLTAASQHVDAVACLNGTAHGTLPAGQSADTCLTADNYGRLEKTRAKVALLAAAKCVIVPDFAYPGPEAIGDTASREDLGLIRDLFGADLAASAIDFEADKTSAKCQLIAAKWAGKLLKTAVTIVRACEKLGLKDRSIDDAAKLAACTSALATDPAGTFTKLIGKLALVLPKKCPGVDVATAFPGNCRAASDLAGCIGRDVRCRACLALNDGDGVYADCDTVDDGAANGSCCPDLDADGSGACPDAPQDCDDTDPSKHPGAPELCDGIDNNCNQIIDDYPVDVDASCGASNAAPCAYGSVQCYSGALICAGSVNPVAEACNALDDDCDGTIDNALAGTGTQCRVPAAAPPGASSPCQAGTQQCTQGIPDCVGFAGPSVQFDSCGVDANCDGQLTFQPDFQTDVSNCGGCGNVCGTGKANSLWTCAQASCQFQGCTADYYDRDGDLSCETACTFVSSQESCNGIDDNCDGQVDEGVIAPSPVQACGVSPAASSPECTSGVSLECVAGAWQCTFPSGVCTGGCSGDDEICDGLDNDCDGLVNENVMNYGAPCASDDGLPPPGHGACRTIGTYACNGANAVACSALKANCSDLPGGCTELCDGIDNDCDGLVDETYKSKGSNAAYFVKPAVTRISGSTIWMYSYEASRPTATSVVPGSGNGYWTSAPSGQTLDKTIACSSQGKLPWFNVSPQEVEQTCSAMGGTICSLDFYKMACSVNGTCSYGYATRGAACATAAVPGSKYCNLGQTYDFNAVSAGDQDGLLPTGSAALQNCYADWTTLNGNTATTGKIYDLTGNLREITKDGSLYTLMGGAFNDDSESGSSCTFTFYTVATSFKLYDTGFRCCFTSDPTL